MKKEIETLPIIALRGMTILPYMVIHFDVSRKKSIKSVEYAMKNGQRIFLVSQKSPDIIKPDRDDVVDYGTVCEIQQIVKLPGGLVRVLVKGLMRARCIDFTGTDDYLEGTVELCGTDEEELDANEREACTELLKEMMNHYYIASGRSQGDNISRNSAIRGLDEIIYEIASECTTDQFKRQAFLDEDDIWLRYEMACTMVSNELNVMEIKKKMSEDIRRKIDKNQKDFILREEIQAIREELGEDNYEEDVDRLRSMTEKLNAPDDIKDRIFREISRYNTLSGSSAEASVSRGYIETMLELPWNKRSKDNNDIVRAEKILNRNHYGLDKVKKRILEVLAVRALKGGNHSPIICLAGPPGTGKTSIASSIAKALNRKYVRICLGGVRDEAEIRGHRKTYIGAMPGRIIEALKSAKVGNPLMLLDEIDKVGTDSRGDTASALLEVLDGEQNSAFKDHYIEEPVDLSDVLFIATANDTQAIPRPLLDRMEVIELNSYTEVEKFHIVKEHLVGKQLKENGLTKRQVSFNDDVLHKIITNYTREAGVRELERQIGACCRKAAMYIVGGEKITNRITAKNLEEYLGPEKYDDEEMQAEDMVGVVKGLAWTSVGGTTLDVEAVLMAGKGGLTLTGKLGDVMKESAQVALGYIRSIADKYNIDPEVFAKNDIHIHVPEGAVPKDGPSAGITMTLAMISALTGRKVRHNIAMTGEVTLHGQVLPIGGLKEKLLAASIIGIKEVLIPDKNGKDLYEVDKEVLDKLKIHTVKNMDEVVEYALRGEE